jgi:hypothetical protein
MRHPADGRVHFSELKQHARSPAHVRLACTTAKELSRAMIVGGTADSIVFGQRGYAVYPGKVRVGKEWELHKAAHPGMYWPNVSEATDAEGAARAVLADPVARDLLDGCTFQKIVQWEAHGLPCASGIAGERGGIDAWNAAPTQSGRRPYTADLKITSDVEPRALQRQAWRMFWIAQGAWLLEACEALGMPAEDHYIIAAEASPPHCVTVMRLSAESLDVGRRQVAGWAERHRQCEAAGQWPGFVQSAVELEPEAWMVDQDGDE